MTKYDSTGEQEGFSINKIMPNDARTLFNIDFKMSPMFILGSARKLFEILY